MTTSSRMISLDCALPCTRRNDLTIYARKNSLAGLAAVLILSLASLSTYAEQTDVLPALAPFHAEYVIKLAGISVGKLVRRLKLSSNGDYSFSSESTGTGIASLFQNNATRENTSGKYLGSMIEPEQYIRERKKGENVKSEKIDFEYSKNIVIKHRKGTEKTVPLDRPSFDPLSYQLQIMLDLATQQSTFSYTIHSVKKVKTYHANTGLIETVSTPFAELSSVKLSDQADNGKKTTFWCAEALGYLPVKVVIEKDGKSTVILLKKYTSHSSKKLMPNE